MTDCRGARGNGSSAAGAALPLSPGHILEQTGSWSALAIAALTWGLAASPSLAQDGDPTLIYRSEGLTLRWHFQGGAYTSV